MFFCMKQLFAISILLLVGVGCMNPGTDSDKSDEPRSQIREETEASTKSEAVIPEEGPQREHFRASDIRAEPYGALTFDIPEGMDIEYIPSIESLNVFLEEGDGAPRERSQIFIRYFDASRFLTLQTVAIYETADLTVGQENYTARRYDIEKKPGVTDFPEQPSWRNERHIVTDTRKGEGFTRYYVIAKHPELDTETYESFLDSITIE